MDNSRGYFFVSFLLYVGQLFSVPHLCGTIKKTTTQSFHISERGSI
uniref:Uncharacterized protein n=1 Tax=virus sp. ctqq75 TaxID=2827999 RepID=A0A8S5REQ5_9VIRU|nr:MAG TPA: hypothetical protein [virus sp. ctqq75]